MFFLISQQSQDNFSSFYQLGPFVISTDAGWKQHTTNTFTCVYKGYVDSGQLTDMLNQIAVQEEPILFGNFCMIVYEHATQQLRIQTDRLRSFPIYVKEGSQVTNLTPLPRTIWSDSLIKINKDFFIVESKFDLIGSIDVTPVTVEEVVNQIDLILTKKIKNFIQFNTLPIKAFLSGGVDSLLVYSYLQKFTQQFELVKCSIIEYDRFWLQNSGDISYYWGYSQIHHWLEPCVLTSGAPGDEFMLRSPCTADLFLKYYNIQITDLLKQKNWLHSLYFNRQKHLDIFRDQTVDKTWSQEQMFWHLCNIVVNDWQHWHLGNTLTWTPLRDLEIFKLLLRLPPEIAISQTMNSDISCQLIERNSSGLTRLISDQKNSGNTMKNLSNFLLQSS